MILVLGGGYMRVPSMVDSESVETTLKTLFAINSRNRNLHLHYTVKHGVLY
jgi:hypothetical protein